MSKPMRNPSDIVYSINIEDLQNVAKEELERELSDEEIKRVEDKLGDFLNWRDAVLNAINATIV